MRLIDAEALCIYANNQKENTIDANDIMRFPTVDAVPVVRCKDCTWQSETISGIRGGNCNQLWCVCFNTWVPMDHYCSKGDRRDSDDICN